MTSKPALVRCWGLRALMACTAWMLAAPVEAGWQSPFELTCFRKHRAACYAPAYVPPPPVVASYAPPVTACYVPPPCPPQYVAKTYYQPVTTYQAQTYTEPQTVYRTSYYYEPVTSYRYSAYYDPCNCSYQQVATPQVSYQLKAQTCPQTTYVQKTQLVPVTQYRQMTYFEPVAPAPCNPCPPAAPAPVVGPLTPAPVAPVAPVAPPAGVQEQRSPPAGVNEYRNGGTTGAADSPLYRSNSSAPGNTRNPAYQAPARPVTPRPDRITNNNAGWRPVQATLAKRAIPE